LAVPVNLIVIVIVQAITLALVIRLFGRRSRLTLSDWLLAFAIGLSFGILMDAILGTYGIFDYLPHGTSSVPVPPRDLSVPVLLFNALASYGTASATVAAVWPRFLGGRGVSRRWLIVCGAIAFVGELGILLLPAGSVELLFAWGATITALGELVLVVNGKCGPLLALFAARDWRPFGRFWLFSVLVGAVYELVNGLARFWVWLPQSQLNETLLRLLIAVVGYLALFHPILVLFVLLRKDTKPHDST
jgi:hypothetical protein